MYNLPRDVISNKLSTFLSPEDLGSLSSTSNHFYDISLYKNNYLYYEILNKKYWSDEDYNNNIDYIYRYKRIKNFIKFLKDKREYWGQESYTDDEWLDQSLFYAKNVDEIKYLINLGADINAYNDVTESDLLFFTVGSISEKTDVLKFLLDNGADISVRDMFDKSPYYIALESNKMNMINVFNEHKYNILTDLYNYELITPEFANVNDTDIDLLVTKIKDISYYGDHGRSYLEEIIVIVESCKY